MVYPTLKHQYLHAITHFITFTNILKQKLEYGKYFLFDKKDLGPLLGVGDGATVQMWFLILIFCFRVNAAVNLPSPPQSYFIYISTGEGEYSSFTYVTVCFIDVCAQVCELSSWHRGLIRCDQQ